MADPNALNLLLRATYLLDALYAAGLDNPDLLPDGTPEYAAAALIRTHLAGHAARLRTLGGTLAAPEAGAVDLTGGAGSGEGPFALVFFDQGEFLRVAQLAEDLAVRAYLGQLDAAAPDDAAFAPLAGLHAATARHAAEVRRLRQALELSDVKPWVSGTAPGFDFEFFEGQADVAALVYGPPDADFGPAATTNEANRVQGPVTFPEGDSRFTEAFDEPATAAQATAFLTLFVP